MSSIEYFSYSPTELAAQLTSQTHSTLAWLCNHDYITKAQYDELTESLIVTPIQNTPSFGERLLARFFKKNSESTSWVFPIIKLDPYSRNNSQDPPKKGKPSLEVVK